MPAHNSTRSGARPSNGTPTIERQSTPAPALCQGGVGAYWGDASDPNAVAVVPAPVASSAPAPAAPVLATPPDWFLNAAAARPGVIERFLAHWRETPKKSPKAATAAKPIKEGA